MATMFIDPGLFRRRAKLEAAVETGDGAGGIQTAWREVAELSVHAEPVGVAARERFDRREMEVTHRVTCRARSDIARGMVFAIGARRLAILTLHDPDESGRYLVCRCREEG